MLRLRRVAGLLLTAFTAAGTCFSGWAGEAGAEAVPI